jgi:hypothetical protein
MGFNGPRRWKERFQNDYVPLVDDARTNYVLARPVVQFAKAVKAKERPRQLLNSLSVAPYQHR